MNAFLEAYICIHSFINNLKAEKYLMSSSFDRLMRCETLTGYAICSIDESRNL